MELLKIVGLIVFVAVVFTIVITCITLLLEKVNAWFDYRKSKKWDANDFPIPESDPELKDYVYDTSIEISPNKLTFTFKKDTSSSTRTYVYRSVQEAIANYSNDFKKEELLFVKRNKSAWSKEETNRELIYALGATVTTLSTQADRIEANLNQLKESLGENDD